MLHFLEHLLESDANKWSTFIKVAPKSGVPIWKRGFRGLCPLTGCTKGLVGTKCVSGEEREEARREGEISAFLWVK